MTCGAGMPYRIAEIAPLQYLLLPDRVLRPRVPRFWLRAYHKFRDWLGAVVYEDPWLAGGQTASPTAKTRKARRTRYPRVVALRKMMREWGLARCRS